MRQSNPLAHFGTQSLMDLEAFQDTDDLLLPKHSLGVEVQQQGHQQQQQDPGRKPSSAAGAGGGLRYSWGRDGGSASHDGIVMP